MAAGGGICWGISGMMGQYLFTHERQCIPRGHPDPASSGGAASVYVLAGEGSQASLRTVAAARQRRDACALRCARCEHEPVPVLSDHPVFQCRRRHDHAGSVAGDGAAGRLRGCAQKAASV